MSRFQVRDPIKLVDDTGAPASTLQVAAGIRIVDLVAQGVPVGDVILGFIWNLVSPANGTALTLLSAADGDGTSRTIEHHTTGASTVDLLPQMSAGDDLQAFTAYTSSASCGLNHDVLMDPMDGGFLVQAGMLFAFIAGGTLADYDAEVWIVTAGDFDC